MIRLKIFEQTKTGYCGPSSLQMVFWHYGLKLGEKQVAEKCKTTKKWGTSEESLIEAIKQFGWHGFFKEGGSIGDLKYFINKNKPVILAWFSEYEGHYSVAVGVDKKFIYLADPEIGKINKISINEFKKIWFDFDGDSVKNPGKWHFEWLLVPTPTEQKYKIKGHYF